MWVIRWAAAILAFAALLVVVWFAQAILFNSHTQVAVVRPVTLLTGIPEGAQGDDGSVACYTDWAVGPLVVDEKFGVAIDDRDIGGGRHPVVWRPGFTARRIGSAVHVYAPNGHVVAITGNSYQIDGGYAPVAGAPADAFWACGRVIPQTD